jgi:MFS family permease
MSFLRSIFVSERNVVMISVSILLVLIPLSAWWNVFPLYLENLGASQVEIGLVYSLFYIITSGSEFVGGFLSDRYGRKLLIVLPTFVFILSHSLTGLALTWTVAAVGFLLTSLFNGIQTPSFISMIAESVDEAKRGRAFGMYEFFLDLGFVIGPLIGGALIPFYGYAPLFYITALACGVSGILRLFFLRETLPEEPQKPIRKFVLPNLDKSFLFFLLGSCLFSFGGGLLTPVTAPYAKGFIGLSFSQIEIMFSVAMVAMLIASVPSGWLVERVGIKKCLGVAWLISGATIGLWAYSWSAEVAVLVMAVSSAFVTLNFIGYNALISQLTVPENRGTTIGFSSLLLGISMGIGSYVGPLVWIGFFPAAPFVLSAIVSIPAVLMLTKVGKTR